MDAMATKRWQVSRHSPAVRPIKDAGRECRDATRAFTLVGDRRSSPRPPQHGGRRVIFLAVAAALLPAAANPDSAVSSVSSGSVEISVSVAPRYKILAVNARDATSAQPVTYSDLLCLATNSSTPTMPVKLVRPATHRPKLREAEFGEDMQPVDGSTTGTWRCGLMEGRSASHNPNPKVELADQLLLVRPE